MTVIRTPKARYTVSGLKGGKLVVRQASGKKRLLGPADTGRARFEAAVQDYLRRGK